VDVVRHTGFSYVEGCWTCSWWTLSGTLVFHTWKVVGHVVGEHCQTQYVPDNVHQLHVHQTCTYEKSEAASADLGS
jgi:hypothetical protein